MSLLNAWVQDDHAILVTDTRAEHPDGTPTQTSKLVMLPHLGAAAASIGNTDLCMAFMHTLSAADGDFDRFLARAPELIDATVDLYASSVGSAMRAEQLVVIVGWSRMRDQAVGICSERKSPRERMNSRFFRGSVVSPGWPGWVERSLAAEQAMVDTAKEQVAFVKRTIPQCPIGGSLLWADVRKDSLTIRNLGELP